MDKALLFLLFFSLTGTRVTAWIGQTTFLVFALMLGGLLLRERHPVWSGILLGFALSKYSLAIAVVLFLIWEWRRRNLLILGLAAAIQIGGVVITAWIGRVTPWAIVNDYIDTFKVFINTPQGLRLGTLFPDSRFFDIAVPVILTLSVLSFLAWLRWKRPWRGTAWELASYEAFAALGMWSLLVAYHRIYDYSTAIIMAPLGLLLLHVPTVWKLSTRQRRVALAMITASFGILIMPGTIVEVFLPPGLAESWLWLFDRLLILAVLGLLGTAIWLMAQPLRVTESQVDEATNLDAFVVNN
jgi:hypothetical protein